jgi:hypothetical protein
MKYQILEFELDGELPKDVVDKIFSILKENGAENIDLDFVDIKYNDLLKKCGEI